MLEALSDATKVNAQYGGHDPKNNNTLHEIPLARLVTPESVFSKSLGIELQLLMQTGGPHPKKVWIHAHPITNRLLGCEFDRECKI